MATSFENEAIPSLSKTFDDQLKRYFDIENSDLPSASQELQDRISTTIKKLEELTVSISDLGVFSSNESSEEISSNSIKFLMLPILLGSLTLKLLKPERKDVLKVASIYLKDFLRRCSYYELTTYTDPVEGDEASSSETAVSSKPTTNVRPTPEELKRMAKEREDKIARYKKKKALNEKLGELKKVIESPSCDEEFVREYYITMINHFICQSLDELDSISMEMNMLQQMKKVNVTKENMLPDKETLKPLRLFLITKDALQKKVFGAGYPSLPVMSVEEFYERRVNEGWFPSRSEVHSSCFTSDAESPKTTSEEAEHDDDDVVEKLRQRDEWRETHRRGWGNTYNRS